MRIIWAKNKALMWFLPPNEPENAGKTKYTRNFEQKPA